MSWSAGCFCVLSDWLTANRGPVEAGCVGLRGCCSSSSGVAEIIVVCRKH